MAIGVLVRPNGERLPVLQIKNREIVEVQGTYVIFETHLRAAIRGKYRLEEATPELQALWGRLMNQEERP